MTSSSRFHNAVPPIAVLWLASAALTLAFAGCGQKEAVAPTPSATATTPAPAPGDSTFDLTFLDAMTQHHQQAIEMAKTAQAKLKDPELKTIADSIPVAQQAQIDRMRGWRDQWFAEAPVTATADMASPSANEPSDQNQLDSMAAGAAYDALFAETMAMHHEAGIRMAQEALPQLRQKPLKRLARQIIKAQRAEVATLRAHA